jgi:hypothetical protein
MYPRNIKKEEKGSIMNTKKGNLVTITFFSKKYSYFPEHIRGSGPRLSPGREKRKLHFQGSHPH